MVIGVHELNFETDIVSEVKALEFHLTAPDLAVLMLDDQGGPSEASIVKPPQGMLSQWVVSCHLFPGKTSTERGSSNTAMLSFSRSRIWSFYSIRIMKYNLQRL